MSVFETEDLGPIPSEATKVFYGVMVIISLSEREYPGSSPGRTTNIAESSNGRTPLFESVERKFLYRFESYLRNNIPLWSNGYDVTL